MKEREMVKIGELVSEILSNPCDNTIKQNIKNEVKNLCEKFQLYEGFYK